MSGQVGCTIGNAAHDLRGLRAEHVAGKPGRSRRYVISPGAPWPASPARRSAGLPVIGPTSTGTTRRYAWR
jgi:hypothetical protein